MNRATELKVPPKPAIIATRAILSRGPGFPARRLPKEPERAHAVTLLEKKKKKKHWNKDMRYHRSSFTTYRFGFFCKYQKDDSYHAKVPNGKLGRQALNFIILHLARTPNGENSKLNANKRLSAL